MSVVDPVHGAEAVSSADRCRVQLRFAPRREAARRTGSPAAARMVDTPVWPAGRPAVLPIRRSHRRFQRPCLAFHPLEFARQGFR